MYKRQLNILNTNLFSYLNQQKFISLLLLQYLPDQNKITYSSAGHEKILLYKKQPSQIVPEIETIKSGGIILGMIENISDFLEEKFLPLDRGDKILLYTDGATEARNPHEELFGLERLIESFQKHAHLPIKDVIQNVYMDIQKFISVRDQYDDITLVGIEKL